MPVSFHLENIKLCHAMSSFAYVIISLFSGTLGWPRTVTCFAFEGSFKCKQSKTRPEISESQRFFLLNDESQAIDSDSSDPSIVFLTREIPGW